MKKSVIFLFALATLVGCGSGPSGEKLFGEKVTGVEKIERDRKGFIALVHDRGNMDSLRMTPFRLYVPGCF